jgi:hypothetical protein
MQRIDRIAEQPADGERGDDQDQAARLRRAFGNQDARDGGEDGQADRAGDGEQIRSGTATGS